MNSISERPELLTGEVWYHKPDATRLYVDILGSSPEITNHLSIVNFKVVNGIGTIATEGMIVNIAAEGEVAVLPGTPYRYEGQMSMLLTIRPALRPAFVTHDNERLGRNERRVLQIRELDSRLMKFIDNPAISKLISMQEDYKK